MCGSDRSIQLFDMNKGTVASELPDAHSRAVHCITQNKVRPIKCSLVIRCKANNHSICEVTYSTRNVSNMWSLWADSSVVRNCKVHGVFNVSDYFLF